MRIYKFRGQRVDTKEWVYGSLIISKIAGKYHYHIQQEDTAGPIYCYAVIPETVGQFTGLTDKNGAEVYPGDIYEHEFDKMLLKWIVEDEDYRFVIVNISVDGYLDYRFPVNSEYYFKERVCIGNIHTKQQ